MFWGFCGFGEGLYEGIAWKEGYYLKGSVRGESEEVMSLEWVFEKASMGGFS